MILLIIVFVLLLVVGARLLRGVFFGGMGGWEDGVAGAVRSGAAGSAARRDGTAVPGRGAMLAGTTR